MKMENGNVLSIITTEFVYNICACNYAALLGFMFQFVKIIFFYTGYKLRTTECTLYAVRINLIFNFQTD